MWYSNAIVVNSKLIRKRNDDKLKQNKNEYVLHHTCVICDKLLILI